MEGKYKRGDVRLAKEYRLQQLISIHPDASYQTLNPILKKEFGSGMRKQDMLKEIRETRPISKPIPRAVRKAEKVEAEPTKPKAEKISVDLLKKQGFYDFEIQRIKNYAKTANAGVILQRAAFERKEYIRKLEVKAARQGYPNPKKAVRDMLKQKMKSGQYDPYDWFKEVYPVAAPSLPRKSHFSGADAKKAKQANDRLAEAKIKPKTESLRLWR